MGSQNWLWQCLTPILNFKDFCGFSALDMMESREISIHVWVFVTDQITEVDWQAEQPSQGVCVWKEMLWWWEALLLQSV